MFKKIAGMLAKGVVTTVVKGLALNTVAAAVNTSEVMAKAVVEPGPSDTSFPITGAVKRKAAVDYMVARVDIPFFSRKTERKIWGVVIDMMVEVFKNLIWGTPKTTGDGTPIVR